MKLKMSVGYLLYALLFPTSSLVVESFTTSSSSDLLHHPKILTSHGYVANDLMGRSLSPTRSKSSILFSTVKDTSTYTLNPQRRIEIRNITRNLLDKKYGAYWSNQITEDQMDSARYAIKGWSQISSSSTDTEESADKIEQIIKRLENEKNNGNEDIDLTAGLYRFAIDIWAKLGFSERAESLLKQMQSMNTLFPNSIILNNLPYNTVIHSWKRHGEGERAQNVLKMMEKANVEPDEISYNGVVLAFARNWGKSRYADNAQTVLEEMEKTDLDIDVFLFNAVMDAHAKSRNPDSAKKAELLLLKMEKYGLEHGVQPNTISYTTVIDAHAKTESKNSAINAERIFKRMETAYAAGKENARPNNRSFNAVINAHVKTNNPSAALKAEELLMKMIELGKGRFTDARPNVVSFTTVINGWAKSSEAGCGERAQRLYELALKQKEDGNEDATPNSFLYSALIDAWIKSGDKGSVDRAFEIFSELHDNYIEGTGDVMPSAFLANQIMDAISRSGQTGAGERAEVILGMLENLYNEYNNDEMKPNAQSYTIAMNAWAKSRSFGKARRAQQLLFKMEDAYKKGNSYAKPNVFAYTAVLNACAFTVGDLIEAKQALQITSKTYRDLCASGYDKPNSVTFATFLRVVLNLIPKGASQQLAIISIFRKCCDHGQVNFLILDILLKSVTQQHLKEVIGYEVDKNDLTIDNIPSEWKSNVKATIRDKRRRR